MIADSIKMSLASSILPLATSQRGESGIHLKTESIIYFRHHSGTFPVKLLNNLPPQNN